MVLYIRESEPSELLNNLRVLSGTLSTSLFLSIRYMAVPFPGMTLPERSADLFSIRTSLI